MPEHAEVTGRGRHDKENGMGRRGWELLVDREESGGKRTRPFHTLQGCCNMET